MLFVFMRDEREKLPKLPTTTNEKTEWGEEKVSHLPKKNTQVSMQTILRILRSCLVSAVASHHATRWSAVFSCWCCVGVYRFARMRLNFRHRPLTIHHFLPICHRCAVSMFSKVFQVRVQCQLKVCKAISRYHPAAAGTEERRLMVNCIIRKTQSAPIWFDIRFVSVNVKSLRGFTKQDENSIWSGKDCEKPNQIYSHLSIGESSLTNEFRAQSDGKLLQSVPFSSHSRNEQQNINRIRQSKHFSLLFIPRMLLFSTFICLLWRSIYNETTWDENFPLLHNSKEQQNRPKHTNINNRRKNTRKRSWEFSHCRIIFHISRFPHGRPRHNSPRCFKKFHSDSPTCSNPHKLKFATIMPPRWWKKCMENFCATSRQSSSLSYESFWQTSSELFNVRLTAHMKIRKINKMRKISPPSLSRLWVFFAPSP